MTASSSPALTRHAELDVPALRAQFPILSTLAHGQPLVYLDNAATTQKPQQVIEAISDYYQRHHANIHRGAYHLSQEATRRYEAARERVARFINAAEPAECLFTRGTTESINLVAASWGAAHLRPGDEIIVSMLEHHSNIVPWQLIAQRTGAEIRVIPINDAGELCLDEYRRLLSPRTRMVAVNHVSNALGTINPVAEIVAAAHEVGAVALIDGAQWVAHGHTDVQALDADFYAFSGHKLYGPTGIGVLYGKRPLLDAMPPYQGGGDMIEHVSFAGTTFAELPNKFEAGTPYIAGAVGLAAAIDWVTAVGVEAMGAHETLLLRRATERLTAIPGLEIKGQAQEKVSVISCVAVDPPIASLDLGAQLDVKGICIRTGHHCCQPVMERFGVPATARASFAAYNTLQEIDSLADALAAILAGARRRSASARGDSATALRDLTAAEPVPIHYPSAAAESPEAAAEEIADLFELLPDWAMRYQQLIDLGQNLPPMPAALKTPATFVPGCQSLVHMAARVRPGSDDVIEFLADSDADLVRGLIALLQQLYSGQTGEAIRGFDAEAFFGRIGLDQHLTLNRRNGLTAMVRRLRELAARGAQGALSG